jgi:hypothetical protein
MNVIRPPGYGARALSAGGRRAVLLGSVTLLAVLSGWHVFYLPGNALKRNVSPPDFAGMNYGLRQIWIEADGRWTLWREGYLDRMQMYFIDPAGRLTTQRDKILSYEGVDVSGVAHGSPKIMASGHGIKIRGSPSYFEWIRRLRPADAPGSISEISWEMQRNQHETGGGPDQLKAGAESDAAASAGKVLPGVPSPEYYEPRKDDWAAPAEGGLREEDGIIVQVSDHLLQVLPGHVYYPSRDSYAYLDPQLWIVSDQQHWLHRIETSVVDGAVVLTPRESRELAISGRTNRDCVLGRNPITGELFIALADGSLLYYDAQTLEPLHEEQLPGEWRQEYAALSLAALPHSPDLGWPLSRAAYQRLMALLMVVFIGSLLVLVTAGRKAWKYTSAATTADTSSSSSSSSTSPPPAIPA